MSINNAIPIFGNKKYFKEYFFSILIFSIALEITLQMEHIYDNYNINLLNNPHENIFTHISFIILKIISIFIIYFISYVFVFLITYSFRTY